MDQRVVTKRVAPGKDHWRYTHGMADTPIYRIFKAMHARCRYPSQTHYWRYGGAGIKVCERWNSFENFLADMGIPEPGMSLDRIDFKGNYEPSNCRWATKIQQANNCKSNHRLELDGENRTLAEWSRVSGVDDGRIWNRLRLGWDHRAAIFDKPLPRGIRRDQSDYQKLAALKVGDSFLLPDSRYERTRKSAATWGLRNNAKFSVNKIDSENYRCIRTK